MDILNKPTCVLDLRQSGIVLTSFSMQASGASRRTRATTGRTYNDRTVSHGRSLQAIAPLHQPKYQPLQRRNNTITLGASLCVFLYSTSLYRGHGYNAHRIKRTTQSAYYLSTLSLTRWGMGLFPRRASKREVLGYPCSTVL